MQHHLNKRMINSYVISQHLLYSRCYIIQNDINYHQWLAWKNLELTARGYLKALQRLLWVPSNTGHPDRPTVKDVHILLTSYSLLSVELHFVVMFTLANGRKDSAPTLCRLCLYICSGFNLFKNFVSHILLIQDVSGGIFHTSGVHSLG